MTNLEALDLHGNRLINLPSDLENLKSMKELNLSSNRFETLPYMVTNLKTLHSLDISHNKLNSLPQRVGRLTKLRVLMVQGKVSRVGGGVADISGGGVICKGVGW